MSRKGENIRKRKDGRWEGRAMLEFSSGERKMHSFYGKTYQEVKQKVIDAKSTGFNTEGNYHQQTEYVLEGNLPQWNKIAEEWLEMIENTKKYSTYIKYRNIYICYIRKFLEENLDFEKRNILNWENVAESDVNYSDSVQKSILSVLRSLFAYASQKYKILVPDIKGGNQKKEKKNIQILSDVEQNVLWRYLAENMNRKLLGILICITTGIRLGEICSLKWSDIDFQNGILHINTTVQRIAVEGYAAKTMLMETEPKTLCSKREIPLPDMLLDLLKNYDRKDRYILNSQFPMEPRTYQNIWRRCQIDAGIGYKNFHSLRHTFATNCINRGADIKSLSEILGHSDVKTTLNRYVHPTMETKRAHINSVYFYFIHSNIIPADSIKGQNTGSYKI